MKQKSFLLSFILCVRSCGFAMGDLKKHNLSEKYIYKKQRDMVKNVIEYLQENYYLELKAFREIQFGSLDIF